MKENEIIINTERCELRKFNADDAECIYELNLDPEVIQYTGDSAFESVAHAREFLQGYNPYKIYGCGRLAVISKRDGSYLGWCGIKYTPELQEYDIGFRFFKRYWGFGYATETAEASIKHGFTNLGIGLIIGRVAADNVASKKVLEKIGLRLSHSAILHEQEALIYKLHRKDWLSS